MRITIKRLRNNERKLALFHGGHKDIFKREEKIIPFERERSELSPEALADVDGYRYELDYYRDLSRYYKEIQEYDIKLELFNSGHKDIFQKKEIIVPPGQEISDLTPEALADLDGYQYKFDYYIQLKDYYKEVEEHARKEELFNSGYKNIFKEKEEIALRYIDIVETGKEKKEEKIWTPAIEDLLAFSGGKTPPYFLDTLLYMLKRVDKDFERKFRGENIKLAIDSKTEVMRLKDFLRLKKTIQSNLI